MTAILGFVVALLIYPGLLAALLVGAILAWARDTSRATVGSGLRPGPLALLGELRAALGRDTLAPEGAQSTALALAPMLALVAPIAALVLLPVPGNPLVSTLGLTGDLVVEGALLLGVPCALLLTGWVTPSPYTRLAADRRARLLAGCALPLVFTLGAVAQQVGTFQLTLADAPAKHPLSILALLTRLLAAAAFACCMPVLARGFALREGEGSLELVADELTEVSGRDLALFRVAEALQLVAVAAFFASAFIIPLLVTASNGVRAVAWVAALLLSGVGIGVWEGLRAAQLPVGERPPLSWWFGIPLLLALFALVLAAFAARS